VISTLIREPARIAALRATPAGLRRLRARAPALVLRCQKYPSLMHRRWDDIKKMSSESAWPVEDLQPYFSFLLSMADLCLGMTEALREGLEEARAAASHLLALDGAATSLRSLRAEVSGVWDWLTATPAKRPLRTTAEIRAGLDRGEYISIEEAIAQAGEKLSEVP
jgi:hypothetical protein